MSIKIEAEKDAGRTGPLSVLKFFIVAIKKFNSSGLFCLFDRDGRINILYVIIVCYKFYSSSTNFSGIAACFLL